MNLMETTIHYLKQDLRWYLIYLMLGIIFFNQILPCNIITVCCILFCNWREYKYDGESEDTTED